LVEPRSFECDIGGRKLVIETGKLAKQASGAVTVQYGDTVVLVTVCVTDEPREGVDFLPLTIDYEERHYAVGKIPGGFIRREGRATQEATLACRLTDRPLRPLIDKGWHNDIQVITTVLSADKENDPTILSLIGASAALSLSPVPFYGPVSAVRIGYLDNEFILNPTLCQLEDSQLDLVVASTRDAIVMVEAGVRELAEDIVLQAAKLAHEANQDIIRLQEELQAACGKPKIEVHAIEVNPDAVAAVAPLADEKLTQALSLKEKKQREQAMDDLRQEVVAILGESFSEEDLRFAVETEVMTVMRRNVLEQGQRLGGRTLTEIRPLSCEVGLLPRTHGSAMFTRGQTQVLTVATLGPIAKEQPLDGLGIQESKRFIHHYNFPPFSNGEVKRMGTPGRREIGHGALAERAILPVLPDGNEFPYTIRLVSEVLSSSGSTSMASTCASSLSLMDAGIPVKRAVAGIAMGLITGDNGEYAVLTDIEGIEDSEGDMDFKVAGTTEGITALQMDIKLKGLSLEILEKAVYQAKEARLYILDVMQQTISSSRPELNRYAPRVHKITINPDKIGSVIGPGGKTIRSITEQTKATIDVQQDGTVYIGSPDGESAQKAMEIIQGLTREIEAGAIYTGKVTRVLDFGAMVEILPGKEGLVHISQLADYRVESVEDEVRVGDEITVKVTEIDNLGRINLSRRAVYDTQSPVTGESVDDLPTSDYPFRKQQRESRPPKTRRY